MPGIRLDIVQAQTKYWCQITGTGWQNQERVAAGEGISSPGFAAISELFPLKGPCFKTKVEFNCQRPNLWCWGQHQETMPSPPSQQIHISAVRNVLPMPSYTQSQKSECFICHYVSEHRLEWQFLSHPSPCLISLAVSVSKVSRIKTPYTGSCSAEQKKLLLTSKYSLKVHIIILLCFYP